eukprot:CAMPEP_0175035452 /NCGR_PEP_ID=MMETSP0005-20121125/23221_1 /TAXON_ID=420556 /ORGANISM="Ochromonas sp., Strain CCMP1393" /LENGTH=393 /DNA_ID=CAMNT_0016296499 /DNA_START=18 /DNA_END=1199 /DNA_ORIENTATION=+
MIYQIVFALTLAATGSAKFYTEDTTHQKYMWEAFKSEYGRDYASMDEENKRFGHFIENMKAVDERNAAERKNGGSAVHGITIFSDLSQAEFEARYLTADVKQKSGLRPAPHTTKPPKADAGLVDWTGIYTTPVKNQGYCGSCWAFSATEQIESDSMRTLGTSYVLSPEQITQCDKTSYGCNGGWTKLHTAAMAGGQNFIRLQWRVDKTSYGCNGGWTKLHTAAMAGGQNFIRLQWRVDKTSYGCNGGWTEHAYDYVKNAGGIETDSAYPYTSYDGVTGSCHSESSEFVIGLTSYSTISGESNMASYVQTTGPLSVCLDASSWNSYTGGIMTTCGDSVDHCVQAVGVDASSGGYWKVRNSWGTSWGESGFILLAYGQNTCDITNDPTYTVVTTV